MPLAGLGVCKKIKKMQTSVRYMQQILATTEIALNPWSRRLIDIYIYVQMCIIFIDICNNRDRIETLGLDAYRYL